MGKSIQPVQSLGTPESTPQSTPQVLPPMNSIPVSSNCYLHSPDAIQKLHAIMYIRVFALCVLYKLTLRRSHGLKI